MPDPRARRHEYEDARQEHADAFEDLQRAVDESAGAHAPEESLDGVALARDRESAAFRRLQLAREMLEKEG